VKFINNCKADRIILVMLIIDCYLVWNW